MSDVDYSITPDELKRLAALAGFEVEESIESVGEVLPEVEFNYDESIDIEDLLREMGRASSPMTQTRLPGTWP